MVNGKCTICEREIDKCDPRLLLVFMTQSDFLENGEVLAVICPKCFLTKRMLEAIKK